MKIKGINFKYIRSLLIGAAVLLAVYELAILFCFLVHPPLPPTLIALLLLFISLKFKVVKEQWVSAICNLLISHMGLFFIPLFVGVIAYLEIIGRNLWSLILVVFFTTFLTMVLTGLFSQMILKRGSK